VDKDHPILSVRQQCNLLSVCRSSVYYSPAEDHNETILANEIHDIWMESTAYGYRKVTVELQNKGYDINHKKVLRIMREMGIAGVYQKHKTTISNKEHKKFPYLLKNVLIDGPNQVWAIDITYIKLNGCFVYLVAIIDWYSRYII
jgi:putative transposase